MIEFRVEFWESVPRSSGLTSIYAAFNGSTVEVAVRNVAKISFPDWDAARASICIQTHDHWSGAYRRTPLEPDLLASTMTAEAMMAIGALHVLTPTASGAVQMEKGDRSIAAAYPRGVVSDGLGNELRVLGPIATGDVPAAAELMRAGLLQKLVIQVARGGDSSAQEIYFAPFHSPGVATSELSGAALALKSRLP